MDHDSELLRRFDEDGVQDAFRELVRRKVNLVYAAALRQVRGDAHLADDVTQAVFLALATRAHALRRHAVLTGWLYTTTRFLALKAVRTQSRWRKREQEANVMNRSTHSNEPASDDLRPVIDEVMHEVGEKDRAALLLRFFEGRSLAEVGAQLGIAENAARMRVDRALEKLRTRLARRGITSSAAILGTSLSAQVAVTAPPALVAGLCASSLAGGVVIVSGATGVGATSLMNLMSAKLVIGAIGTAAAMGIAVLLSEHWRMESKIPEAQITLVQAKSKGKSDSSDLPSDTNMPRTVGRGSADSVTIDDVRARAKAAHKMYNEGKMDGALQGYLWCFHNIKPSQQVVREYYLRLIANVANRHPPARLALQVLREQIQQTISGNSGDIFSIGELASLNELLGESHRNLEAFNLSTPGSPAYQVFGSAVFDELVLDKRYSQAVQVYSLETVLHGIARWEESRGKFREVKDHSRMLSNFAKQFEAVAGAGKTADAAQIAKALLACDGSEGMRKLLRLHAVRAGNTELLTLISLE